MRISLLRISLLRFFKTFHKNLPYANFGLYISLVRFLGQKVYFANAILSFLILLLRLQENLPKFVLANKVNLAYMYVHQLLGNATFGSWKKSC